MRIVFLGTPEFALPSLDALYNKYEIAAVVCQPDRERDRKGNVIVGAVAARAEKLGIKVLRYEKIGSDGADELALLKPDLMITCAYGQFLSQKILDIPPLGVLNVHGSLLPAYRGSAPIQRALIDGATETGITIMKTDIGMDSGPILAAERVPIDPGDYAPELFDKLSIVGARLLLSVIGDYASGKITPIAQDESAVTYAPRLEKSEANLDFSLSATKLRNLIRGFGYGSCVMGGTPVKIYRAEVAENPDSAPFGTILACVGGNFTVACGEGALRITELQQAGKRLVTAADFLNGAKLTAGSRLFAEGAFGND